MKRIIQTLLAFLIATSTAHAGEIGFASGESCTVSANSVACVPTGGRGSLVIESSVVAFSDLRDAFTPGWDGSGDVTCTACYVNALFPGCSAVGDIVNTTRKKAALANLACSLRVAVIQAERNAARASADSGVDVNPDIGGGDPG